MFEGYQCRPVAVLIKDPTQVAQDALDVLEHGQPRATGWMQRLRTDAPRRVSAHAISGATLFDGRICCGEALGRFEGRADLPLPYDVTCPGCGRIYRVRLDLVRRS